MASIGLAWFHMARKGFKILAEKATNRAMRGGGAHTETCGAGGGGAL